MRNEKNSFLQGVMLYIIKTLRVLYSSVICDVCVKYLVEIL